MRRISLLAFGLALFGLSTVSQAQWTAFNDHVPGLTNSVPIQTHPNATTLKIPSTTGPVSTNLKNFATGTNLNVTLAITRSAGGVIYNAFGAAGAAGTPLGDAFNGFVYFGSGTDCNVELYNVQNGSVTYTFTGLNPAKLYNFKGAAIRGNSTQTTNWTKVELQSAVSYSNAHSARVVTKTQVAALETNQVAVTFGYNSTAALGDLVDWENINPGSDGSFSIVCTHYLGATNSLGGTPPAGSHGYAITGIRLEEVGNSPPLITVQPQNRTVNSGQTATFTVTAVGSQPLSYQWYQNGSMIPGATSASYTTPATTVDDSGSTFYVLVYNTFGSATSSNATLTVVSQPFTLLAITNSWRYNDANTDLGTEWRNVSYNDSAWAQGPGGLSAGEDNAAILPFLNTRTLALNGIYAYPTYYFRTHFTFNGDPNSVSITQSNLIDDGAVMYLNGQEFYRRTMLPAPSVITFSTVSTAGATEGAWSNNIVPPSALVQGDNVLAVEVHQANTTSSDAVMAMSLTARPLSPTLLAITKNPADLTINEGSPATFTVEFSGQRPKFQWYKWTNDLPVAVPGGTNQTLTLTNTSLSSGGFYFVVVSNVINTVVSRSALLTVQGDLAGPLLVRADGTFAPTNVTVSFSEFITEATATNIANYKITNVTSGGTLTISKAVLQNGTNVVLTSAARVSGANYLLIVNNVRDISPQNNLIAPNSSIPISSLITLIGLEQGGWDFYDPSGGGPLNPGSNWNQINFDFGPPADDLWGHGGAGLFVYDHTGEDLPGGRNTALSQGAITKYFRFPFTFNVSPVDAALRLRHVIDDGAIFYLNGIEVYRFNMAPGAATESTAANFTIAVASSSEYIDLPAQLLRSGTNLLAAELHGVSDFDVDWVFGAELVAQISSYATGAVVITSGPSDLTVEEGQPATFAFRGMGAATFQWRTNGTPIPGGTNAVYTINSTPLSWNGKLFSVAASNSSGGIISGNARLTVIGDMTPPALLGATLLSTTSISVAFSEPLNAARAMNTAHYRITNAAGPNLTISSATLMNGTNVILAVSPVSSSGFYTVVVNNLQDVATIPNTMVSNSTATIGFQLTIPIDATWRFYTNNVDLGTGWRAIGYNDTAAPWSSGPALIADETDGVPPEPIKTHISRLDNTVYHYTFYFRYHFTLPGGATTATATFRHIIDDGAIFYINGQQFHSFNIGADASTVTYTTQASVANEPAYNGPYTETLTNLVGGDNVIAVEVHQGGDASSDITFGATFGIQVPSIVTIPTAPAVLRISKQAANVNVDWTPRGFLLEKKNVLSPNTLWVPVTNRPPWVVSPASTNQTFYRLRQ